VRLSAPPPPPLCPATSALPLALTAAAVCAGFTPYVVNKSEDIDALNGTRSAFPRGLLSL